MLTGLSGAGARGPVSGFGDKVEDKKVIARG